MLKSFLQLGLVQARGFAAKATHGIVWKRPTYVNAIHPSKSGDLSKARVVPLDELAYEFKNIPEVEQLNEQARKLLTVGHNGGGAHCEILRREHVELVKRHQTDTTTTEAKIGFMTARIRCMQEHCEKFPRDGKSKRVCCELIAKRKKFLKYLRRWDYKRFEWILEKLNLVYKAPPERFHWITRKESTVKLADIKCDQIKAEKMEIYRKQLQTQRAQLIKHYEENPL